MTRVLWLSVFVCVVQCLPMSQDELEDFSNFLLKTSSLDIHVKSAEPDASFDEDEEVSDHAWEESGKFEGDLILNDRQRRLIVENVEGLSRNGLTDSTKRWPNNEVIYFIQREHFTSGQVQAIQDGIDDLARASCVKFRPYRRGDRDAVVIQGSRRGCFSQVGYQGGYQVLNLSGRHPVGRGCFRHGTVVHEFLHSLGFYHMQSSPDRDDYIDVVWANIVQPARHNFRKYNSFSVSDFGVGYDYDSVLHYSRRAFSANGQDTLVPKKSGAQIGQRAGLSDKDTQKLNKMYCDADNDPSVQSDESTAKKPINKKKKPKNQPFEGHGIGYHQGKTVVIRLPAAETYKLPNVPSTNVFDFSKTPQVVPPEAAGYRFGEEITFSYKPISTLEIDTIKEYNDPDVKPVGNKNTGSQNTEGDAIPHTENKDGPSSSQDSYEIKPEYVPIDDYDKDLKDAFDRLTKIVKQHIYPQGKGYEHMINKDYSTFFVPLQNKKSDSLNYYLNDKLEPPTSFETSKITPLKQTVDVSIQTSANDKIRKNQIQDREDQSFRTALPTKQPYSFYDQTETPHYATLEYLKDRNDYSNLYSLKIPDSSSIEEHSGISTEGKKYKEDIKINPYDGAFYTDYTHRNIKGISTDAPIQENTSEEVKLNNHRMNNRSQKILFGEVIDSSFRTLLPTNKPYSAYEQTDTPNYATLEYLKNRHEISHSYHPKKPHVETNDSAKDHPTEGDWYVKNSYKHNPANYDQDSFSDYVQPEQKEHDGYNSRDDAGKSTGDTSDIQNTSSYESGDREKENYYKKEDERLTDENVDNNKNKEAVSELRHSYHDREHEYFGHDDKKENDSATDEDEERKKNDDDSQHHFQDFLPISSYDPNYDEEHNSSSVETSKEGETEVAPRKTQAYTLYDVPVPLAKDWYKISYAVPEISKVNENTS